MAASLVSTGTCWAGVASVGGLDPTSSQLLAVIDEHPQHLELDIVGQHPEPVCAHRDHRDGVGVGLEVVAGVEQSHPGVELGWHVHHVFTISQQPRCQRTAGTLLPSTEYAARSGQAATRLRIAA
jgi:hypothetical protein